MVKSCKSKINIFECWTPINYRYPIKNKSLNSLSFSVESTLFTSGHRSASSTCSTCSTCGGVSIMVRSWMGFHQFSEVEKWCFNMVYPLVNVYSLRTGKSPWLISVNQLVHTGQWLQQRAVRSVSHYQRVTIEKWWFHVGFCEGNMLGFHGDFHLTSNEKWWFNRLTTLW